MYIFTCTSVEDHGHCKTAEFVTADNNSRLHLYIYEDDPVPAVGEPVAVMFGSLVSAPGNLPADPPVVPDPAPSVSQDIPSQVGETATDEQHAAGDVEQGKE